MTKTLILSNKKGHIIKDLNDWEKAFFEVDDAKHWKEGRSALALAKYFTYPTISESYGISMLREYLQNIITNDFDFSKGEIEHESKFDTFRGKGRIQDLIIWGEATDLKVAICIEAKVDEAFGNSITLSYENAEKVLKSKPNSNCKRRIENLCAKYFQNEDIKSLDNIKYQLLHYLEGSIIEAKKIGGIAFMPIMVFHTDSYNNKIGSMNKKDFEIFINQLRFEPLNINNGFPIYKKEIEAVTVYTSYIEIKQYSQK